jgi:hypothetical protein
MNIHVEALRVSRVRGLRRRRCEFITIAARSVDQAPAPLRQLGATVPTLAQGIVEEVAGTSPTAIRLPAWSGEIALWLRPRLTELEVHSHEMTRLQDVMNWAVSDWRVEGDSNRRGASGEIC